MENTLTEQLGPTHSNEEFQTFSPNFSIYEALLKAFPEINTWCDNTRKDYSHGEWEVLARLIIMYSVLWKILGIVKSSHFRLVCYEIEITKIQLIYKCVSHIHRYTWLILFYMTQVEKYLTIFNNSL